ncbi:MAG TPA: type IX secretion system membrane protein PorP/SprF, partial [Chitinophagales bacterium]|nr:type IX secretion system membrane protein PorP/SprF [Chitinophagales bacterium]
FDMHAGLLHQSNIKDIVGITTGFSVYHLVEPKESFLGQNVRLADRFVVHEGLRIKAMTHFYITPNFIFMYQNKAQEINLGAAFEYHMQVPKSELVTSIGGWYRIGDAAILTAGLEYFHTRLMFAYDINASSLKPATNNRGAFELAVIYTGFLKSKQVSAPILVPCPRM